MKEQRINVAIDEKLKRDIKVKASLQGKTITEIVINLLKKWLNK